MHLAAPGGPAKHTSDEPATLRCTPSLLRARRSCASTRATASRCTTSSRHPRRCDSTPPIPPQPHTLVKCPSPHSCPCPCPPLALSLCYTTSSRRPPPTHAGRHRARAPLRLRVLGRDARAAARPDQAAGRCAHTACNTLSPHALATRTAHALHTDPHALHTPFRRMCRDGWA